MKITTVNYQALFNLGNFENQKIGFEAQLEEGESPEEAIEALKQRVAAVADPSAVEQIARRNELTVELRELCRKVKKAREVWEQTAEFLRAQGLKPDAPAFPFSSVKELVPVATQERVQVIENEEDRAAQLEDTPY